ncbi:hypothetical protein GCM10010329_17130 [Streptomyces spiroverticillatus]|uniref:Uncharacterized protein n=1 Tax=Streptomyces finlayi TaxID=67296 RepID=A0A918WTF3_9ACTN|nr:hypothetical protein [Streptomyces finlayi]GGZ96494.1 hypothetical protein GCM10010329_17130 [Streptomyces spiroverticillatus]GHC81863.1 hypothetical protein GCM10010334_09610 [Streptomyces finlayi]
MHTAENGADERTEPQEWPEPTDEQLAMIRRLLAPEIHRARTERAADPFAA